MVQRWLTDPSQGNQLGQRNDAKGERGAAAHATAAYGVLLSHHHELQLRRSPLPHVAVIDAQLRGRVGAPQDWAGC